MIDTPAFDVAEVRRAYDRRSALYARMVAPMEWHQHVIALEAAAIKPDERVLEVAVGPGRALLEIVRRVHPQNIVHGIDLSAEMLRIARAHVEAHGHVNIDLREAHARELPFPDGSFDVLYNGYMLDLVSLRDMPTILGEFHRVLRPGGRLVLLNMSKPDEQAATLREWLYERLPKRWVLTLVGGCRPVLMQEQTTRAGFNRVERRFLGGGPAQGGSKCLPMQPRKCPTEF